jgi:hypothetical protein
MLRPTAQTRYNPALPSLQFGKLRVELFKELLIGEIRLERFGYKQDRAALRAERL